MVKYSSSQEVKSGIPLGGIGAGKIEILPNGTLDFITFQNNPHQPISSLRAQEENSPPKGILGNHFAIRTETVSPPRKNFSCLLQTAQISDYAHIEEIQFERLFPFAYLNYKDARLPIKIALCAYSPFILNNTKDSSLPLAFFDFTVENPLAEELKVSLLICLANTVGQWVVGRRNRIEENKRFLSLHLSAANPLRDDHLFGEILLSIPKNKDLSITYLSKWNLQKRPFVLDRDSVNLRAFELFRETGQLPNINLTKAVNAESWVLAGALCVSTSLKPRQTKNIALTYNWYFPKTRNLSHYYQKNFKNVFNIAHYGLKNKQKFYTQTKKRQEIILHNKRLPSWLKDALINNLYPFVSSSVFSQEGDFCLLEAPEVCPLTGTLDVRFYGSIATCLFFPELELNELRAFARAQLPDGYIPHDLGRLRMDSPSLGTTGLFWKDLNSKFVLMAYRDYLWIKNEQFLNSLYASCLLAMEWLIAADKNNDYLPDNEGQDTTFDLWPFYGASAYASSLFLAALLAIIKMAHIKKDKKTQVKYSQWLLKARENFEKKLWHSPYFICYNNATVNDESCTLAQLMGQWYASMLDLGHIVDKGKIKRTIAAIFSLNANFSEYGIVNSMSKDKKIDLSNPHAKNFFIGVTYAFCALAIYEGFTKEALALARKIWDNLANIQRNPWNQPDTVDSQNGKYLFGDHYTRPLSIWAIPLALSKKEKPIKLMFKRLRSK